MTMENTTTFEKQFNHYLLWKITSTSLSMTKARLVHVRFPGSNAFERPNLAQVRISELMVFLIRRDHGDKQYVGQCLVNDDDDGDGDDDDDDDDDGDDDDDDNDDDDGDGDDDDDAVMLGCWDDAVGELLVEKGYRSFGPLTRQGHVAMILSLGEHSAYRHPMVPPNPSVLPTRISIFVRSLSPFFSFIIVCANQKSRFFGCSLSLSLYIYMRESDPILSKATEG